MYHFCKRLWLFVPLLVLACPGMGQDMEERMIIRDTGDSLLQKAFRTTFDTNGQYYFETLVNPKSSRFTLTTNAKTYNAVYWDKTMAIAPYKALVANAFFSDSSRKKLYYKNKLGTRVYGPRAGRIREVLEYGKENIAIELCIGAKSYLYINDSLVSVADSLHQVWSCAFSDNNNMLYSVLTNGSYRLYLNHRLIDSSKEPFSNIAINNYKYYTYVKPGQGKLFAHVPGKTFGPFGIVEHTDIWNNNAYYFTGCADSQCYVLVNGKLFDKIPEAHTISEDPATGTDLYRSDEQITVEPFGPDNFLFTYNQDNDNGTLLNINGKVTHHNYNMASVVSWSKNEGYAFYGYRNDTNGIERIYKNLNGVEKRLPYFRKARYRPHCLYIAASGASLYYYETKDSIYTFRNDTLLGQPTSRQKFVLWDATALPQTHPEGLEYFQGINMDSVSYIMYNNTLSRPLPYINPKYDRIDEPAKGNIVAGDMNGNGFFMIQFLAKGRYMLNINNTLYNELDGINYIFPEQSYLDSHVLIFYGIKDGAFYQFKVHYP